MRIGYVLKVYPRFSETFIVNEVLAHERAGTQVEIFSLREATEGRFHEMHARVQAPVTYLPARSLASERLWADLVLARDTFPGLFGVLDGFRDAAARDVHQAVLLALAARERGITHLHAHFGSVATTVARMAARIAGVPYSFTAHAKDIYWEGVDEADLVTKLGDAGKVVTVSEFNVDHLRALCPGADVTRVYNGLDLAAFPYADPGERAPVVVAVGRLVEKKGFGDLIDACALLAARGRPVRCRIAGAGPLEQELRERIARAGLDDWVELLGPRSQDAVRDLVQEAAVFAAPCVVGEDGNRDGLPTVLLEAMALGTPCVSTPVTGIPEVVRDGETGLLVGERDPRALADALQRLLEDAPLRVRLAEAARALIEDEFDADRTAAAMRAALSRPRRAAVAA